MCALEPLLAHPLSARIGWVLIHFMWQGLLIAAGVAACLLVLRRRSPNARYAVSCVGLGLMLLAPLVTVALIETPSGHPAHQPYVPALSASQSASGPSVDAPKLKVPFNERVTAAAKAAKRRAASERARAAWVHTKAWLAPRAPLISLIWAIGVLLLSCRNGAACWWVRRLRYHGVCAVPESVTALCRQACARLRVHLPVSLRLSERVDGPVLIGWWQPVVLLPASVVIGVPVEHLEAILYHELAHIRRWDYLVNLVQIGIETLLFYHPAVWWLSARVRVERERICDDMAVTACGDRVRYAEALARIETLRVRRLQSVLSVSGDLLVDRIRRLAGWNVSAPGRTLAALVCVVLVAAILGQVSVAMAQPARNVLPERTVYFPEDRSLGSVEIGRQEGVQVLPPVDTVGQGQGPRYSGSLGGGTLGSSEAMGAVHVPQGYELHVRVSESGVADLSPLGYLRADDLQGITLWDLPVRDDDLQYLAGMTTLRVVDLGNTNISDEGLSYLDGMTTIQELNLRLTRVTDAGLEYLRGMTNMRDLCLNRTAVTDAGMESLSNMTQLEYLDLWRAGISDEGMAYLSGMTHMRELGLEDTQITDAGLAYLASMPHLEDLNLENNAITDAGLRYLAELKDLTILNIADTFVTDEGMPLLLTLQNLRSLMLPLQITLRH